MIWFLDDNKRRRMIFWDTFPSARLFESAPDIISALGHATEPLDTLYLDHDLCGEEYVDSNRNDCGMEVVRWITHNRPAIERIVVHSHNADARREMVRQLRASGYNAEGIPFLKLIVRINESKDKEDGPDADRK